MLTGAPASMQKFELASELRRHASQRPGRSRARRWHSQLLRRMGDGIPSDALRVWNFHVDWTTPPTPPSVSDPPSRPIRSSRLSSLNTSVSPRFRSRGTTQTLDTLADRLMHRLQYRDLRLVPDSGRQPHGPRRCQLPRITPASTGSSCATAARLVHPSAVHLFTRYRTIAGWAASPWTRAGDIALGYSVSSASVYPSVRYTGRLATDTLNTHADRSHAGGRRRLADRHATAGVTTA